MTCLVGLRQSSRTVRELLSSLITATRHDIIVLRIPDRAPWHEFVALWPFLSR